MDCVAVGNVAALGEGRSLGGDLEFMRSSRCIEIEESQKSLLCVSSGAKYPSSRHRN